MPKPTKKSPYRYSSSPYNDFRRKSKASSSATEDEIGYDSEDSGDYGSEDFYEGSTSKKKKDKRRRDLDFANDYHPLRLGVKIEKRLLVIEYQTPSNKRIFQHYIQIDKYVDSGSLAMSISKSNSASGSMKEQMKAEVKKVVDQIYRDSFHKDYVSHDTIVYDDIFRLAR